MLVRESCGCLSRLCLAGWSLRGVLGLVWVSLLSYSEQMCTEGMARGRPVTQSTSYSALNTGSPNGLYPVYFTYICPGPALWSVPCSFMPSCPGWILVWTLAFHLPWGQHTPNSNLVMECEGRPSVDACLSQQNNTQCRIDFWNVLWGSWPWTLVLSHSLQLLL